MSTSALATAWSSLSPIGLAELDAAAALTHRVDTKYLVPTHVLAEVLGQLPPTHACLTINGLRSFRYTTTYVNSSDLACYHDHRRGVRLRWKARTRVYEDSGQARWEVKLKDGRGGTIKHALALPASADGELTPPMRTFLSDVLAQVYGRTAPTALSPLLRVGYRRSTLTQLGEENRMTVDSDLRTASGAGEARLRLALVLVETKSPAGRSPAGRSPADQALRVVGARPVSVSKYCAGMALLHPDLPSHGWRQLLRRNFQVGAPVAGGLGVAA